MDSPTPTLNAILVLTVLCAVLVVASRIRSLRRAGAFEGITNDDGPVAPPRTRVPLNRFERSAMLGIYAGILGVLALGLKAFVGMSMGPSGPRGWRGYVPMLVIAVMVIIQSALLWRAAKTHGPHILADELPSSDDRLIGGFGSAGAPASPEAEPPAQRGHGDHGR